MLLFPPQITYNGFLICFVFCFFLGANESSREVVLLNNHLCFSKIALGLFLRKTQALCCYVHECFHMRDTKWGQQLRGLLLKIRLQTHCTCHHLFLLLHDCSNHQTNLCQRQYSSEMPSHNLLRYTRSILTICGDQSKSLSRLLLPSVHHCPCCSSPS